MLISLDKIADQEGFDWALHAEAGYYDNCSGRPRNGNRLVDRDADIMRQWLLKKATMEWVYPLSIKTAFIRTHYVS